MNSRILPLALAALAAGAGAPALAQQPTLTVYTYSSFAGEYGPGPVVKERFEAQCDCTLEFVGSDDAGTLVSRLQLEGEDTGADIVLGLDTNLLSQARETGLFAPHEADLSSLDLPVEWSDDTFLPFDWGWFAFVYERDRLETPPASFAELLEADDISIVIQDPRTSSPGLGLLLWVEEVFGDDAEAAWRTLAPRIVTVTRGWSEAYGLFLEGEADMVLSYTTSPAYHAIAEEDDGYAAAIFEEGHAMQVELAAITTTTDQPELALDFMTFMLSEDFQSVIAERNWMYPARLDDEHLPQTFRDLPRPQTSLLLDSDEAGAIREEAIDRWLSAM